MLGKLAFTSHSATFVSRSPARRMLPCASVAEVSPSTTGDLYEVLRIGRTASQAEIKTAYRTLAKLYHPDATSRFMDSSTAADGRDFIEIRNAYATLSDPNARSVYDMSLRVSSLSRRDTDGERGRLYTTRRWETDQCW